MVHAAKLRALQEGATLTDLLVDGLQLRLEQDSSQRPLPVSRSCSGLQPGISWERLDKDQADQEAWR